MRTLWLCGLAIVGAGLCAQAQDNASSRRSARPPGGSGGGAGAQVTSPHEMSGRLAAQLQLTPEQRTKFDEITAKYETQWQQRSEHTEQFRQLALQYRQARQSGDSKHAEEIAQQMRDLGGGRGQVLREYLSEVETVLEPAQVERLNQIRARIRGRGADVASGAGGLRQLVQRLPEELSLTADQRAKFDQLVAEQGGGGAGQRGQLREMRPLIQELRQARQSGDQQRVAELEGQLAELRGAQPGPQAFFDKLEPILTDEQKAKLADLRARLATPATGANDVRRLLSAAQRLDLNEDQRARVREIVRSARQAGANATADPQAQAKLAQDVKSQIEALLDANQVNEFERLLERGQRPARPGDRDASEGAGQGQGGGAGGGRPARPGGGGGRNP